MYIVLWLFSLFLLSSCRVEPLLLASHPTSGPSGSPGDVHWDSLKDCVREMGWESCHRFKAVEQTWREQAPIGQKTIRILITGDTGKRGASVAQPHVDSKLVAKIATIACAGTCSSAVFLGDNLYDFGLKEKEDSLFLRNFTQLYFGSSRGAVDLYFVQGNHDWSPFFPSRDRAQLLHRDLRFYLGERVHGDAHFWHAQMGPVRMVALDSNYFVRKCKPVWKRGAGKTGAGHRALRADRVEEWRRHDIACPGESEPGAQAISLKGVEAILGAAPFESTVVVAHHPWYGNGRHGTAGWFRDLNCSLAMSPGRRASSAALCADLWPGGAWRVVLERVVRSRAALFLAGHDHGVQVHHDGNQPRTLSVIVGSGSKVSPPGTGTGEGERFFQKNMVVQQQCRLGFAIVEKVQSVLSVQVYSFAGSGTEACQEVQRRRQPHWQQKLLNQTFVVNGIEGIHCHRFSLADEGWLSGAPCQSYEPLEPMVDAKASPLLD